MGTWLTVGRNTTLTSKNTVMGPVPQETRNDYAGEDQHQFTSPTDPASKG
jgi:hypothetical protein